MGRVKTFTNGGSLLPGDLNSIQDDYEFGFSTYRELMERRFSLAAPAAGTYMFGDGGGGLAPGATNASADQYAFYFDPADRTANTRTNKYRVRAQLFTNAVAPAVNFTVGLYPVATFGGASGSAPFVNTLGTVVTGSTVVFTAPGASSQPQGNSGDFTAPAAGYYVIAVLVSGASAANSAVQIRGHLQNRQV